MNYFVATANIEQAGLMPNIDKLTAGAYELIVFDEPAGTLGLKLKPEFLRGANPTGEELDRDQTGGEATPAIAVAHPKGRTNLSGNCGAGKIPPRGHFAPGTPLE